MAIGEVASASHLIATEIPQDSEVASISQLVAASVPQDSEVASISQLVAVEIEGETQISTLGLLLAVTFPAIEQEEEFWVATNRHLGVIAPNSEIKGTPNIDFAIT